MKNQSKFLLTLTVLLFFGIQSVIGQVSAQVQTELTNLLLAKSDLQGGYDLGWKKVSVKRALSKPLQDAFCKEVGASASEKKTLQEKWSEIAGIASENGMTLEGLEASELLAGNPALQFSYDELVKVTGLVKTYNPKDRAYLVTPDEGKWLLRAISKKERDKWTKEFFGSGVGGKEVFWKKLDELSSVAAKIVPTYKPNPQNFVNHNAADEAMLKKELGDLSKIKIHQIGLASKTWEIQKNALDIPQKRFKVGYIWAKDSGDDFSYCKLYQVNIIQDYTGAGKYGESYATYLENWVFGCP
ncbi:hypothetical protein WSM22_23300 [Cytophagales bacterium WSM2-2]|nr:hypothetical protein WSM22_23300 [Cytophagales bacterium WSM2-2]